VRTVYLGTSDFAAALLRDLAQTPHRPALVVTRPDRPKGRGRVLSPPPVAEVATELGIGVFQPERVNEDEAIDRIASAEPEALIVCAYGAILKEPLLSRWPMLNVHPSLLPRWRGAAPVERAIMAGDEQTGVAIMRPTEELDAGPVCLMRTEPIGPSDDYGSLAARLRALAAELLVQALEEQPAFEEQTEEGVTYAEKITGADRTLDPARAAAELERSVRALRPHIGARIELSDGAFLGVHAAIPSDQPGVEAGALRDSGGHLLYGCADGALELLEVLPAGGRPMAGSDYLRGHGLPA
jgi:methionyl-tRNA formyltransferase